jgi:uncharacterized protein YdeI (BOF family)
MLRKLTAAVFAAALIAAPAFAAETPSATSNPATQQVPAKQTKQSHSLRGPHHKVRHAKPLHHYKHLASEKKGSSPKQMQGKPATPSAAN